MTRIICLCRRGRSIDSYLARRLCHPDNHMHRCSEAFFSQPFVGHESPQARVQSVNQILCGFFIIPDTMDRALEVTINPIGNRTRSEKRVWNNGQKRLKLVRCPPWLLSDVGAVMPAQPRGHAPAIGTADVEQWPAACWRRQIGSSCHTTDFLPLSRLPSDAEI